MSSGEEVAVSDAPARGPRKPSRKNKKDPKECCFTCRIPIAIHLGKPGPGNCFGMAVTKAFNDLFLLVQTIEGKLDEERREARDREDRLNKKR